MFLLTVRQTLRYGAREGVRVALAPLVTDVPIILVSLLVLQRLQGHDGVLGAVAFAGGLYVLGIGLQTVRAEPLVLPHAASAPASLRQGALINALNPHPYLFWTTVGGPYLVRATQDSVAPAWLFIVGFYVCLVGSKILVALTTGRFCGWLTGRPYRSILRGLGLLLCGFAGMLLRDALMLMGWLSG